MAIHLYSHESHHIFWFLPTPRYLHFQNTDTFKDFNGWKIMIYFNI